MMNIINFSLIFAIIINIYISIIIIYNNYKKIIKFIIDLIVVYFYEYYKLFIIFVNILINILNAIYKKLFTKIKNRKEKNYIRRYYLHDTYYYILSIDPTIEEVQNAMTILKIHKKYMNKTTYMLENNRLNNLLLTIN